MTDHMHSPRRPSWWTVAIVVGGGILLAALADSARGQEAPTPEQSAAVQVGVYLGLCPTFQHEERLVVSRLEEVGRPDLVAGVVEARRLVEARVDRGEFPEWARPLGPVVQVVDRARCAREIEQAYAELKRAYEDGPY